MIKDGKAGWIVGQGMPKNVKELCMDANPTEIQFKLLRAAIAAFPGKIVYRNHPKFKGLPHYWTVVKEDHVPRRGYQYGEIT